MSDRLDREIRSTVVELVESSPQPRPVQQALRPLSRPSPSGSLSSGLVRMGAVAAIVLVVGLAGAWVGRNLIPSEPADIPMVEGVVGPEPNFEPFGTEAALGSPGGVLLPEVDESTLVGDVFAIGRIPPSNDLEVFTWESTTGETCLQVVGEGFRDTSCSSDSTGEGSSDLSDGPPAFVTTRTAEDDTIEVIAVWHVPDGTSVVGMAVGDDVRWQRPKANVAAMVFDPGAARVFLEAWDTDMESVAFTLFSPRQLLDPVEQGETEVEGAPEDLVAIQASHPVAELRADAATMREFSDALDSAGYRFTCSRGGGPPYGLCLVGADGVVVVVPFEGSAGQTVRISDPGLAQDVVVPLDQDQMIGIANMAGAGVTGVIEHLGEWSGELSAPSLLVPRG